MSCDVRSLLTRLATVILALGFGASAAAQTDAVPRIEISGNVGALGGSQTFTQTSTLSVNVETANISTVHAVNTALLFDVGGGVRLVRQLWVQVAVTNGTQRVDAAVSANIPHPLLFSRPRLVEGSVPGLDRNELDVHLDAMWQFSAGRAIDVKAMAGPTFFKVKQDLVSQVTYSESYPFDAASFTGATTAQRTKSGFGFNAGLDITHRFTAAMGIGGIVRYSAADLDFTDASTGSASVKAGGIEAAAGVRIRF